MKENDKGRVYAVLGSGRQGTAAAYDFLRFGDAEQVILADSDPVAAEHAANRLRTLLPDHAGLIRTATVNATDAADVTEFLAPVRTLLSAVPWYMHPQVAAAAIAS